MANCPNCGSDHIQLRQETNVDWGRAIAGWALFGVIGGAVGAVTGEDRSSNACLQCGASWKAADLHKLQKIIQKLINIKIDLSKDNDRVFINDFIVKFSSDLEYIVKIEKKCSERIKFIQSKSGENTIGASLSGCFISFLLLGLFSSVAGTFGLLLGSIIFILPILGFVIGRQLDESYKKNIRNKILQVKKEAEDKILRVEESIKLEVVNFASHYFSISNEDIYPPSQSKKNELSVLPKYCPQCEKKLPPPFQSSSRTVCSKCGWSNKSKQ
jgi:hypothetical protein